MMLCILKISLSKYNLIMGTIATDNNQLTLYYHSKSSLGKQTLAYIKTTSGKINAVDLFETKLTGTQWVDIAKKLNSNLSDLVAQNHPDFKLYYNISNDLSSDDWIKVLQKHPIVLRCPILINGENYHLIETPSKIAKILESEGFSQDARSLE